MMFEEEFPSLNIKMQVDTIKYPPHYSMWTMERLLEDVEKHCLDKAKVKAAINNLEGLMVVSNTFGCPAWISKYNEAIRNCQKRLKQELKL